MKIDCYAAFGPKQQLKKHSYTQEELGLHDVLIAITHCGICHSDIHLIDDDWGMSVYPLVPGHEIVGTVIERGEKVQSLKKGERVGVGWQAGACFECEWCMKGDENLCDKDQPTCVRRPGGYATAIAIDSRFAFSIPPELSSENAAPLLCGGITVYSPLRQYDIKAPMKVGVVGIGGLGHLALQFAKGFGCEVTAFSHTPSKEKEAKELGAQHFVNISDSAELKKASRSMDTVISAVSSDLDWKAFMGVLRPKGKLIVVGASPNPINVTAGVLIGDQKMIAGSVIGNRWLIKEMLEFSARHNIQAKTEVMPMSDANTAIKKVRENKARYRIVLTNISQKGK